MATAAHAPLTNDAPASLVSLLGGPRASIVGLLHSTGEATVAEVAEHLGVSEVATRRHLHVLIDEGLVSVGERRQARGRPAGCYRLTERAERLFPQAYDRFANEVLEFLSDTQGREGVAEFLRWRVERETRALSEAVDADDLHERLTQLAAALSSAGFDASVSEEGTELRLVQEHCAIADVAREHPEVCDYEAAAFSRVLGGGVAVARRDTIANGASACVCSVAANHAPAADEPRPTRFTPLPTVH